jgi:hypothetical protein
MARNILLTALFLGMVGIFYWQWQLIQAGNESSEASSDSVSQQITVNTDISSIKVTQVFQNLKSNHEYKILAPRSISKWECVKMNGKQCASKDTDPKTFRPQSGKLNIQFSIPYTNGSSTLLLTNWIMRLQNVKVQDNKIEVVDSIFRKGTWVASLPLIGSNRHEFIDYYVFEGTGESPSLYWQAKPLNISYKNRYFSVYSQNNKITNPFSKLKLPNGPVYMVYIHSNQHPHTSIPGMVITNSQLSDEMVQKEWLSNYFIHKFQRNSSNDWLVDVFSSLYLNEPAQTEKGIFIIKQLKSQLKKSDIQKLMKSILQQDIVNINELDQELGELKGLKTYFFGVNNKQNATLIFFDMRSVRINGDVATNEEGIVVSNELFFPFVKTMKSLGFEAKENHGQDSILLKKNGKQFLFYYNQSSFLYNGQKYGLLENPFRRENGIIYINQRGIQTLFKAEIGESKQEIHIYDKEN